MLHHTSIEEVYRLAVLVIKPKGPIVDSPCLSLSYDNARANVAV